MPAAKSLAVFLFLLGASQLLFSITVSCHHLLLLQLLYLSLLVHGQALEDLAIQILGSPILEVRPRFWAHGSHLAA
jgi:hypothetical protein